MNTDSLFRPFSLKSLNIKNRIVMAPMTRSFSPNGTPTPDVAAYYRKRAEGEVGLILSEGTVIDRVSSSNDANIPHFYGEQALAGWQNVINGVHTAGGAMAPQIWHMGVMNNHHSGWLPAEPFEGPSGLNKPGFNNGKTMTDADIADTIAAFGRAAADAKRLGFDCVEIHGAHGYLIDQFFWEGTNERTDIYGGKTLAERTRFATEVIKEVRKQVGEDFAVIIRLSQWKPADYNYKLTQTPQEMEAWLNPLADAGADIFHCSQRRFWEPEFEGSELNFAGWAKKLTGKATISVGSVGLSGEFLAAFAGESSEPSSLDELLRRMDNNEFDLVAVGRPLLADPNWVKKIHEGRTSELKGFSKAALTELVVD
ncbi:2,4-dienoyl-CoA reductase-like NADH-dependent reductase (Old Yellow Enzyme family) [Mucilaginibacter frigoritolerans]|jgi:2,4-dienoyl-CoA reductase-like NADH-dependent reductase (Old Yellow Enzyme family)|uniref:2,4-dienoyl-CoA reductase-like NADH-dependent reductase (Old Yellow Enzyme family) n=1 Tax=Mucilaginibacter frigoritolerans TaxID=652788 RepID=A0A562TMP6_9SPHI|nr:NADH:flavin oxidoreductase [Mucilaginibacter frigoritolerans]TWI94835.1 2,4-dienoyl-CoA reductase-like NADH-dependent reductase (Old Yellow Enzyme family) [Mucilaginibacter frigoritolerans]